MIAISDQKGSNYSQDDEYSEPYSQSQPSQTTVKTDQKNLINSLKQSDTVKNTSTNQNITSSSKQSINKISKQSLPKQTLTEKDSESIKDLNQSKSEALPKKQNERDSSQVSKDISYADDFDED